MDPNQPGFGQPQPGAYPQQPAPQGMGDTPFATAKSMGYVPNEEEKQQAFYAHLFGALAIFIGCSSGIHLVGPLVPMFMAKQKTPFMMYHVNQSFWFQTALFCINAALAIVFTLISLVTCGIGGFLYLLNFFPFLIALVYPILVGLKAKEGEWSEYAVVGAKVLAQKSPVFK